MEGPGKQYPYEKTGGLEPGRFKPIEEPSMSVELATISSRISSLEAGHRVSLPTPCEEVSDLISMAPGSQEATTDYK
jgi:hypothetical protein